MMNILSRLKPLWLMLFTSAATLFLHSELTIPAYLIVLFGGLAGYGLYTVATHTPENVNQLSKC